MSLDIIMGGMPRGGTTVAAKFLSLHPNCFCYAGETHLLPWMHSMFGQVACRPEKLDLIIRFLEHQFITTLVNAPRLSVSRGAHPGNLIFDEKSVAHLVDAVRAHLKAGLFGKDLFAAALASLAEVLALVDKRGVKGEKTPSNIFAMADYAGAFSSKSVVVMREPAGVVRSMQARINGGDEFSGPFAGGVEANIGLYLEYALAARRVLEISPESLLVRYEDLSMYPGEAIRGMFALFSSEPDERVLKFVEGAADQEIADRAPMHYRRLQIDVGFKDMKPADIWKLFSITRNVRDFFGYHDDALSDLGFEIPSAWPGDRVPDKIIPLFGFSETPADGGWPVMKRSGGLIAYFSSGRKCRIFLDLESRFPEVVDVPVQLEVKLNGRLVDTRRVAGGSQRTSVEIEVLEEDMNRMGSAGGYVLIELSSSVAYCPMGHCLDNDDHREVSFQLRSWSINRKFRWVWF